MEVVLKILLVEDEFVSRMKLNKILSHFGTCDLVTTGKQLIEAFILAHEEGNPYGLISVDIRLPDMMGQEIVQEIRKWEKQHNVAVQEKEARILMVTAMSDGKNIMSSFKEGCEAYVVKPFDLDKITQALAKINVLPQSR